MKLIVTGGTGFIGRALCQTLEHDGHEVVILTRSCGAQVQGRQRLVSWAPPAPGPWQREIDGADGIVHLAGESVVAKRWSAEQKRRITDSRIGSTIAVVEAIRQAARKPAALVSASAIGYYGPRGDEPLREDAPPGSDFLAQVCRQWEQAAQGAEALGVRVVRLRIGMVLAPDGGALAKMLLPFKLGLGGPLGSGRQWVSWIHRDDVAGLIRWALRETRVKGVVNATAPSPVTMREFARALGGALHRPAVLPVPGVAIRLLMGEVAELLLSGQRVLPDAATRFGFQFAYPLLADALSACVARGASAAH